MSDFSNITVTSHDDGKVSLLIGNQAISERYDVHLDAGIIDELKVLEDGKSLKLFDQFIFSHTDLNFEHSYSYATVILKTETEYQLHRNFVYKITAETQAPVEHVITNQGQPMTTEDVKLFINKQVQMSLEKYTDLNYAY
ncbi:hypothetical protein G9F32_04745 [Acinetobacter sp. 194]|uniref:hypothetical protein n=1 Tax=Acinetobacter shaoyimingii TaxID=2715164 RepID=UPI00140DA5D0|nr:hypothetical protein [Acinetobacter shaoyimingii]NHB57343.1 hypothetical protein [Acinetobacter shaoyimingii]